MLLIYLSASICGYERHSTLHGEYARVLDTCLASCVQRLGHSLRCPSTKKQQLDPLNEGETLTFGSDKRIASRVDTGHVERALGPLCSLHRLSRLLFGSFNRIKQLEKPQRSQVRRNLRRAAGISRKWRPEIYSFQPF